MSVSSALPAGKRPKLLFSGYYGLGNAGDEAVLAGLLQGIKTLGWKTEATVLSADPALTERWHGVRAVPRMKPSLLRAVAGCDLLVSGGGSLLQDVTSQASLFYYLGVIGLARAMGKRVAVAAQGMGPLERPSSRRWTAAALNRCDLLTVRDEDSARLLREIGVKRSVAVTADPAFLLGSDGGPVDFNGWTTVPSKPSYVGLALREWRDRDAVAWGSALCRELLKRGQAPLLIPMHEPDDRVLSERIAERADGLVRIAPKPDRLGSVLKEIARCDLLIGMRLHALLLAANFGVPFLAWSYDPKVTSFVRRAGNPRSLLPADVTPEGCADLAQDTIRLMFDFQNVSRLRRDALETVRKIASMPGL
jgi:polysaccharide pyruvyl transferase CsaB